MAGKQAYQLFDITLARRTRISPSLTRFTFTGPEVGQMVRYAPDQRIKLFFAQPGAGLAPLFEYPPGLDWYSAYLALPDVIRPFMRTYTIRALRPALGEVDVEFVLHGDTGPASRWAINARPGDTLAMVAPRTGAFFEVPREDDAQPLADTVWLARGGDPAREQGERLLEAVLAAAVPASR